MWIVFSFPVFCSRIGLDWACTVADILHSLNACPEWSTVIAAFTDHCIQQLPQTLKRTNLFTLLVLVGFPEVGRIHCISTLYTVLLDFRSSVVTPLCVRCCVWAPRRCLSTTPMNSTTWYCSNTSQKRTMLQWWMLRHARGKQVSAVVALYSHSFANVWK